MFVVVLSFEVTLVSLPILLLLPKKKLTNKYKKNFVVLQSIGIIVIKRRETRSVNHTYRYSNGQFNPYNSANGD